ncbi:ribokinase [Roseomonas marmotae]|uniref:Ribokinase n=1 Tax=Roseomonas marmotae TaxID=2768161 RepID=A0ABS3K851_9PROT|nr:ribokinase [Roseomonas marmotae]MBO1073619.1 ribokinase [Roseomonas marmotae]MBO1073649.1 ribokinase [Roseomonas marmotae]QTI80201.1 ribokinase [Roseomonas marmotae]
MAQDRPASPPRQSMTEPVLLALGSINADFQVRVPGAPAVGITQPASDFLRVGGGKAANRAFLARRLGHPAWLLGRVGDDDLRQQALAPLREAGVDLDGVSVAEGVATAVSMIAVLPDGKKSILLAGNANDAWGEPEAEAVARTIARAPGGSLLSLDHEVPGFVVAQAVRAARTRGLPVLLDPSPSDRVDPDILAHVTAVSPNPDEAEGVTGIAVKDVSTAIAAARWFAERGVELAFVKLGDGGCVLLRDGRATHIPPVPMEVVDSTGAGDAFAGGLAVALLEGMPPFEAALFATAASHRAVTGYGSQQAYPDRAEIEALVPALRDAARAA